VRGNVERLLTPRKYSGYYINHLRNIRGLSIFPAPSICAFHFILRVNSDLLPNSISRLVFVMDFKGFTHCQQNTYKLKKLSNAAA
jgi:hypothetical protein